MKKLLIIIVLLSTYYLSFSQSPQSFSYQTVVRDNFGNIIQNQNTAFRISILQSTAFTDVYVETNSVTTNDFGLANLEIGTGTVVSGDFASIDWGSDISYIQVEIDTNGGTNFQLMGLSQLLSVPYALYAESTADSSLWEKNANDIYYNIGNVGIGAVTPNSKLLVQSDASAGINDDIFSVLNANGDTVFAVYQEGVRIWVDDNGGTKANGSRGGFAVGGFNPAKAGFTNEYFRVTPDSVRVYINDDYVSSKANGSRGGFAVGGFNPAKGTNTDNYFFVQDDSTRVYIADSTSGFGIANIQSGLEQTYVDLTTENYLIGHQSGQQLMPGGAGSTIGKYNNFYGYQTGLNLTTGSYNTLLGYQACLFDLTGDYNVYIGSKSGYLSNDSRWSTCVGMQSGYFNEGDDNTFIGHNSGYRNTFGGHNTCIGKSSGYDNQTGQMNVYIGSSAGGDNVTGANNVYVGAFAGWMGDLGDNNTYIGNWAGVGNDGSGNVFIGNMTGYQVSSNRSDDLFIDNSNTSTPLIYGAFDTDMVGINDAYPTANLHIKQVGTGEEGLAIENDGDTDVWSWEVGANDLQLYFNGTYIGYWDDASGNYTAVSDKRLKKDIEIINESILPKILKLELVNYRLNHADENSQKTIGFIAQDVQKLLPDIVSQREDGYLSLNYDNFGIISIKAIQEQQKLIDDLKKENDILKSENKQILNRLEKVEALINSTLKN